MARSVDNIDLHSLICNRDILRQNGDTSLPFEVVVVKDQLSQLLLLSRLTRLIDHPVHQSGLAVIDVGDNSDIPDILHTTNLYLRERIETPPELRVQN